MSSSNDHTKNTDSPKAQAPGDSTAGEGHVPLPGVPFQVDDSRAPATYANFCRITGGPEDLLLDFGLDPNAYGRTNQQATIRQRIVMNYYTAKRLLGGLQLVVQQHETQFGQLETDPQKRLKQPQ